MTDLRKAAEQALGYPSLYDITGDIKGLNTLLVPVEEVKQLEEMNRQLREQNTSLDAECGRLEAENAELRGLKPEIPQRPPHNNDASHQHPALPRYGLRWNGPGQPVSVPMADGYWTPFHLALAAIHAALREALAKPAAPEWIAVSEKMPTPGMPVLACYKSGRKIIAFWTPANTVVSDEDSDIGVYDEATDTWYDPDGWYECVENWDEYSAIFVNEGEVTHWMPLPAAPQPKDKP